MTKIIALHTDGTVSLIDFSNREFAGGLGPLRLSRNRKPNDATYTFNYDVYSTDLPLNSFAISFLGTSSVDDIMNRDIRGPAYFIKWAPSSSSIDGKRVMVNASTDDYPVLLKYNDHSSPSPLCLIL